MKPTEINIGQVWKIHQTSDPKKYLVFRIKQIIGIEVYSDILINNDYTNHPASWWIYEHNILKEERVQLYTKDRCSICHQNLI